MIFQINGRSGFTTLQDVVATGELQAALGVFAGMALQAIRL